MTLNKWRLFGAGCKVQKTAADNFIKEINNSSSLGKKIVTEITPLEKFYLAENYHQDYYATHPGNPYCEVVINPKLEKIQQQFTALLKGILTLRGYESH